MADLFFLFLMTIGIGLTLYGLYSIRMSLASRNWSTTSGQVVSSEIKQSIGYNDKINYRPVIRYTYKVGNSEYSAERRCFGDDISVSTSEPSKRAVAQYPLGATVTVYYNPSNLSEAVLEPGVGSEGIGAMSGGLLFVAIGIAGLAFGWGS